MSPTAEYAVGPAEIFTLFFVTLGPLKILGPFARRTRDLDGPTLRNVAVWSFAIATIAIVAGSLLGSVLATNWQVSIPSLLIAAGIIFLLVALNQLLQQYEPPHAAVASPPLPSSPMAAALQLVFPIVLTPYGVAASIVLLASSQEVQRTEMIVSLLVAVMVLNLLAMLFARKMLVGVTIIVLQVVGAVLGVLQAGMAIQFVIFGLQRLGVIAG